MHEIGKPPPADVVEIGQGAFLECLSCCFVAGDRALGIAGDRFVDPFHPLGRIESAVAQFDQPTCSPGNGDGGSPAYSVAGNSGDGLSGNGKVSKVAVSV